MSRLKARAIEKEEEKDRNAILSKPEKGTKLLSGARPVPSSRFFFLRQAGAVRNALVGKNPALPRGLRQTRGKNAIETDDGRLRVLFDEASRAPSLEISHPTLGEIKLTEKDLKKLVLAEDFLAKVPHSSMPTDFIPKTGSEKLGLVSRLSGVVDAFKGHWGPKVRNHYEFRVERHDPEVWIRAWEDRLTIRYNPDTQQSWIELQMGDAQKKIPVTESLLLKGRDVPDWAIEEPSGDLE